VKVGLRTKEARSSSEKKGVDVTVETLTQLREAGLLDDLSSPHLTDKGRDWLRTLAELETTEIVESGEVQADLVLSTNGIFR
jgi:hypothetical protein